MTDNTQIMSRTSRLVIRNWQDNDFDVFYRLNNNEKVMHFFPTCLTREKAGQKFALTRQSLHETGMGFLACQERQSGKLIGMCGLLIANIGRIIPENTIEIGWRLLPEYWGQGFATEAAKATLNIGFQQRKQEKIVAFAVKTNLPSIRVMQRIGMTEGKELKEFDHPRVPDDTSHLKRHVFYHICKNEWESL